MARQLVTKVSITGEVKAFAGPVAPQGYLICDGSAVSRVDYASLFSVIGISHGQGDGSTTFNLPDYRGQFLRGRIAIANVTGSGTASANQATFTNHGFNRTGLRVRLASGTLSGLALSTNYYVIVVDSNTLAFATSQANALANTRIAISGANSAVITQWMDPDTSSRVASNVGGGSGNGIGSAQEDAMQGHKHGLPVTNISYLGAGPNPTVDQGFNNNLTPQPNAMQPITDGANGIPRTSGETRPINAYVNYIIKV